MPENGWKTMKTQRVFPGTTYSLDCIDECTCGAICAECGEEPAAVDDCGHWDFGYGPLGVKCIVKSGYNGER